MKAFVTMKKALVTAPVVIVPDWSMPFELMSDASDHFVKVMLGQRRRNIFIQFTIQHKTLADLQLNYTTTGKELLDVVFAFNKFIAYFIGT